MSIPYLNIARAVALRTGQLNDAATAAAFEAVYTSSLAAALAGMEIPLSELKRLVLSAEQRLASVCARQKNPVLKKGLAARSADLDCDGADLPAVDQNNHAFIGAFDGFYDADTDRPLTEKPKQAVQRYLRMMYDDFTGYDIYHFALDGTRIFHTRPGGAYARGCSWDYATQATAYGASGNSPLAQELEDWWIAECLKMCAQEGWFDAEAGTYGRIAAAMEADVKQGVIPQAVLPDSTASSEPVKN